ncbi:MAG: hypothetical protein ONB37_19130 [candidate division KSB1 bacterium]|nr:hypothetical protein [candidate division KSB1 bacterium]
MSDNHVVKIFTMLQEFPCGVGSSCCGPIGQTEEEINAFKAGLEQKLNVKVETFDVKDGKAMRDHREILGLLRSFGWGVLPIIFVGDEVVSMGVPASLEDAVAAIQTKLNHVEI